MDALSLPGWVRVGRRSKFGREVRGWALGFAATATLAIIAWFQGMPQLSGEAMGLVVLCIAAELLPLRLPRLGLRLSLSIPFLSLIAARHGAIWTWAAELVALAASMAVTAWADDRPIRRSDLVVNWATGSATVAAGLLAMVALPDQPFTWWHPALFAIASTASAWIAIRYLTPRRSRRRESTIGYAMMTIMLAAALSVPVGVIAMEGDLWAIAPLLAPIAVIRATIRSRFEIVEGQYETISALMLMLQNAHPYTHGHLERVADLAEAVGLKLGLSRHRARLLREAAILHDIGKIAIDETILEKPARLTEEEFAHVKQHSVFGAHILEQCDLFRAMVPWIRHHHERPDGGGYPHRLRAQEIPLESRIIAVVDAFDAMVGGVMAHERRPYRAPMTVDEAFNELDRCSGTQFDRDVVRAFKASVIEAGMA